MTDLYYNNEKYSKLKELEIGVIFDSSPSRISAENALKSVTLTSKSKTFNFLALIALQIYALFVDVQQLDTEYFTLLQNIQVKIFLTK